MSGREKYKKSIQLVNIEVLPYRTTGKNKTKKREKLINTQYKI